MTFLRPFVEAKAVVRGSVYMRRLTSIVAVNKQGVIGLGNALPWRIRSDMQFFKSATSGNVVIMGRKTHDSLGQCLPARHNIVVSNQLSLFESTADCVLRYGIFDALSAAERAPARFSEIFVIGGATMYEQYAPFVDRYFVTVIDKVIKGGDAFFEDSIIGNDSDWDIQRIAGGTANENGDEADFEIFEMTSRHLQARQALRQAGIDDWNSRSRGMSKRRSSRDISARDSNQMSLAALA